MKKRLPQLKEQITYNWVYKIVALLVAISIWVTTIENKKEVLRSKEVRLEFLLGSKNKLEITKDLNVFIKVVGPKNYVKRYMQATSSILLDLSDIGAGLKKIDIKASDLNLPNGVRLYSIEPSSIELDIKEIK